MFVPPTELPSRVFSELPRPLLFAHRGASRHAPENTLDAFALALRLGAQVLELDVHRSADGEAMVCHDETLERTTDGHGRLDAHTCAQLQRLDAGCRFTTPSGARPFAGRDVRMPRLVDLVETFPQAAFNIEIKHGDPTFVARVIQIVAALPPNCVVLAAENDAIMAALEAARPPCGLGLSRTQLWHVFMRSLVGLPPTPYAGRAMQIPRRYLGVPLARRRALVLAQRAHVDVHLWVINDIQAAQKYLDRGVDGLMTDDPGLLQPLFLRRNP